MRSKMVRARTKVSFIDTRSATEIIRCTRNKGKMEATSLLAILVDQLDDLGSESHA